MNWELHFSAVIDINLTVLSHLIDQIPGRLNFVTSRVQHPTSSAGTASSVSSAANESKPICKCQIIHLKGSSWRD